MIPFFDPAALSSVILAATLTCNPATPPEVKVEFNNHTPVQVNDRTLADLGAMQTDTTFSHSKNEIFSTRGITQGRMRNKFEMAYTETFDMQKTQYCMAPTQIRVSVDYIPVIYIAKELAAGSCEYDVTLKHEIQHTNIDIITIREYLPRIEAAARQAAYSLGVAGPIAPHQREAAQQTHMARVQKAIDTATADFDSVRHRRQQAIDTRQEYLRLSKMCPPPKR
jgi:hypothetical protein